MITNLEELVLQCEDQNSRKGIEEAIKCYQAGAFRAAIVTTYVTVCFDLIEKLKVLAAAGDGEAIQAEEKLVKYQEQHDSGNAQAIKSLLEFERGLLEFFRDKFDFFGKNEFDELARLREDRNRCAHPTFFKSSLPFFPSAELTRLHIRNALALVLTQPPRQGKAAVENLKALVYSKYFPTTRGDAATRLKGSELGSARPALVRAFIDAMVFGAAKKGANSEYIDQSLAAIYAVVDLHREIAVPRLITNANKLLMSADERGIIIGSSLVLREVEVGENVETAAKVVVKSYVKGFADKKVSGSIVCLGCKLSWLKPTALEVLSASDTGVLTNISSKIEDVPREVVEHAVAKLCTVQNWHQANEYVSSFGLRFASEFTSDDLNTIFSKARSKEADLLGSGGFDELLKALCSEGQARRKEVAALLDAHELKDYLPEEDASSPL